MDAKSGQTLTIYSPADDTLVTDQVQVAGAEDVEAAVNAAEAAFKGSWRNTPAPKKAMIMLKFADLLEAKAGEIAALETVAMGQPISIATWIVGWAVEAIRCKR